MPDLTFNPEDYLTVFLMALFTSMFLQGWIKPAFAWYKTKNEDGYDLALNTCALFVALVFSYAGLIAADILPETTLAILMQTGFRGLVAAFLSVFGYKGLKAAIDRLGSGKGTLED